jgi:predicted aminopeptidase
MPTGLKAHACRATALLGVVLITTALAGCSTAGYYWQSVTGHLAMMSAARPIDDWVQNPQTPDKLKHRLALAREIRRFAVTELKLPDNSSYQRYADLHRSAVVWNVTAAPALSLELKSWCFPVAGCVTYKGFFSQDDAKALALELKAQGLDVSINAVPAYSTLGWLNWAGGDPLLNTFINDPEGQLARLVFHELAHQVVYVQGDTAFNESFATAVERLGSERWLAQHASPAAQSDYARFYQRRQQFRALTLALRRELKALYEGVEPNNLTPPERKALLARKEAAIEKFRQDYVDLKASWGGYAGYDAWVARTNNASLGALAAYDELVPAFEALFESLGGDWDRFYAEVKRLSALPKTERRLELAQAQKTMAP